MKTAGQGALEEGEESSSIIVSHSEEVSPTLSHVVDAVQLLGGEGSNGR